MGVRGLLTALGMTLPADVTTYTQILTDTALSSCQVWLCGQPFRVFGGNPPLVSFLV